MISRSLIRSVLCSIVFFSCVLVFGQKVEAKSDFLSSYQVIYVVAPTGLTTVTQNITITNTQSRTFPKEFVLLVDSSKIQNVIAHDDKGAISPVTSVSNNKTTIRLALNNQVAGTGKQVSFTVRYDTESIAKKVGSIWEVTIPSIAESPDIQVYNVTLQTPAEFGSNAYTSPLPANGRTWTKDQLTAGPVSLAFGDRQTFQVQLSYHLVNSQKTVSTQEIAIPPDTAYQKVSIRSIEPSPETLVRSPDGNWLAKYSLSPGQELDILADMIIDVSVYPRESFAEEPIQTADFLLPKPFWETTTAEIQALARVHTTPRAIYDYVTHALSYDTNRVVQSPNRKGAALALASPRESLCTDFTDVFIAIARAAGIPAREVVGYAYATNPTTHPLSLVADVLHAWPEYYDAELKRWVPVDPTWSATSRGANYFDKLDFNHIVFAIHGSSSDYPYPPGFYHKSGRAASDVTVAFTEHTPEEQLETLKATIEFPDIAVAGFATQGKLILENTSGINIDETDILLISRVYGFRLQTTESHITPYKKITIPFSLHIKDPFASSPDTVTAIVRGEVVRKKIKVQPIYITLLPYLGGVLLILMGGIAYARYKKRR